MSYDREKHIRQLAYQKSEKAGHPIGMENRFWLEAEKEYDSNLFENSNQPTDIYSNFMQKYYSLIDSIYGFYNYEKDKNILSKLGEEYIKMIHNNRDSFQNLFNTNKRKNWGLYDVSFLSNDTDINEISKRSLLMSDSTLIGQSGNNRTYSIHKEYVEYNDPYNTGGSEYYVSNFDAEKLGDWLVSLKTNLERGQMFCLPQTQIDVHVQGDHGGSSSTYDRNYLYDAVIKNGKVKTFQNDNLPKNKFIQYLAEVPIPIINDVSLKSFADIYNSEIDASNNLKLLLRERFLELDLAKNSTIAETDLLKIGNKISKESVTACKDLRRLNKRRAIQASGVTLGAGLATLACINLELFADYKFLISGASGLGAILKLIDQHFVFGEMKTNNNYLFLWLLQRAK